MVVCVQFAVALATDTTDCLCLTGCFAAGVCTGCCDFFAVCDLFTAVQTVGVAGVACFATVANYSITNLGITLVVVCVQFAVALATDTTDCLCLTGCFAAGVCTGCCDFFAVCDLFTAVQTVGVAGVACFATVANYSITNLGITLVVVCVQIAVALAAYFTFCLCLTACFAAGVCTGCGDFFAVCDLFTAVQTVGVAGVACFATVANYSITNLGITLVVVCVQIAVALAAYFTFCLCLTACFAAGVVTGCGNFSLCGDYVTAAGVLFACSDTRSATGGLLSFTDSNYFADVIVCVYRDFGLCNGEYATSGTLLTVGETGFHTGSCSAGHIDDLVRGVSVSVHGNYFSNYIAASAGFLLRTCFDTSSVLGDYPIAVGVAQIGDGGFANDCTTSTDFLGVACFGAGRIYGFGTGFAYMVCEILFGCSMAFGVNATVGTLLTCGEAAFLTGCGNFSHINNIYVIFIVDALTYRSSQDCATISTLLACGKAFNLTGCGYCGDGSGVAGVVALINSQSLNLSIGTSCTLHGDGACCDTGSGGLGAFHFYGVGVFTGSGSNGFTTFGTGLCGDTGCCCTGGVSCQFAAGKYIGFVGALCVTYGAGLPIHCQSLAGCGSLQICIDGFLLGKLMVCITIYLEGIGIIGADIAAGAALIIHSLCDTSCRTLQSVGICSLNCVGMARCWDGSTGFNGCLTVVAVDITGVTVFGMGVFLCVNHAGVFVGASGAHVTVTFACIPETIIYAVFVGSFVGVGSRKIRSVCVLQPCGGDGDVHLGHGGVSLRSLISNSFGTNRIDDNLTCSFGACNIRTVARCISSTINFHSAVDIDFRVNQGGICTLCGRSVYSGITYRDKLEAASTICAPFILIIDIHRLSGA